jgi:hypothetical protein
MLAESKAKFSPICTSLLTDATTTDGRLAFFFCSFPWLGLQLSFLGGILHILGTCSSSPADSVIWLPTPFAGVAVVRF